MSEKTKKGRGRCSCALKGIAGVVSSSSSSSSSPLFLPCPLSSFVHRCALCLLCARSVSVFLCGHPATPTVARDCRARTGALLLDRPSADFFYLFPPSFDRFWFNFFARLMNCFIIVIVVDVVIISELRRWFPQQQQVSSRRRRRRRVSSSCPSSSSCSSFYHRWLSNLQPLCLLTSK